MKIHTIIFDLGNVLIGYGWKDYLKKIAPRQEAYQRVEQAVFLNPAWVEHDKGLLTEEEELREFIAADPAYEKEIREVYEHIGECAWLFPYTLDWIRELKKQGYRIYALSNWPKRMYEQCREKLSFLKEMDGYLLSYREHVIKPDPAVFYRLFERYGIVPEEAVFLDDTPGHIQAAKKLGLQGIVFTSWEQARRELEALGVK